MDGGGGGGKDELEEKEGDAGEGAEGEAGEENGSEEVPEHPVIPTKSPPGYGQMTLAADGPAPIGADGGTQERVEAASAEDRQPENPEACVHWTFDDV